MRAASAVVIVWLLLAACSSGGAGPEPAGSIKVTESEYKFQPNSLHVKAGKVVIFLVNAGTMQHDMLIQDRSGATIARSELVGAGDSTVFDVSNLPAGTYSFFCDVPGHRQLGMQGTLIAT